MTLPDLSRMALVASDSWAALAERLGVLGVDLDYVAQFARAAEHMAEPMRGPMRKWHLRRRQEPAADAVRMLFFQDPVTEAQAREALTSPLFDLFVQAGLLVQKEAGFVSPFYLNIIGPLYVLCDDLTYGQEAVMGAGETTADLCRASLPIQPCDTILDVGCGAGTAALVLSAHARLVVGTDINPRAIVLSRINAALNRITNVEFRQGDLFEPVKEETFDLIVSQPPFVAQPEDPDVPAATYLYGGARGDELTLRLLGQIKAHLSPQGRAVLLVDWPVVDEHPLENRVRQALDAAVCNVLFVQAPGTDLDDYCTAYASKEFPQLGEPFERRAIARRDHLEKMGIKKLRLGFAIIERAEHAPGWTSTVPTRPLTEVALTSERVDRMLAARNLLAKGPEELLRAQLRIPKGTTLREVESSEETRRITAEFPSEVMVPPVTVDLGTMGVVALVHEASTVRAALEQLSERNQQELAQVLDSGLAVVSKALLVGLLEVSGNGVSEVHVA